MEPVPILFGVSCAWAVWGSARGDARYFAWLCTAGWAISNIGWLHNALYVMPAFDLLVLVTAISLWRLDTTPWKSRFTKLAFVQVCLHVFNALTRGAYFVLYVHALNASFAAQLIIVGTTGNGHDRSFDLRRYLRWLGVAHHSATGR